MTDLIGQTIGNYQIEALLGKGGMGQVFRGRHLRLGRLAAIKVVHDPLSSDPSFRIRFQQEARNAAGLTHPHIVTVYDFGEQGARAYLAMELIAGGSLRERLHQQASAGQGWPLAVGLELIRQAADALDYAHAQGMVHRDIKPDNLLLDDGPSDTPILKIGDFGLARLAGDSHLTATGAAIGTPAYMSPEQCRGGELDGRSDLYSLGIVLYEVACGRVPFVIRTGVDAIYQHIYAPPPAPRELRPDLPPLLESIILRCLAKAPADRFATAAELANALGMLLRSERPGMLSEIVPILSDTLMGPGPTVIQPSADGMPAPDVGTLIAAARPTLRVLDDQGATVQAIELRAARLKIGRAPNSDLLLDGEGVSRNHLTLAWDGQQVIVTDLGASNGTLLDGQPLAPSTPTVWPWRAMARVGPYWLRLEPPATLAAPSPGTTPPPGGMLAHELGATASFGTQSLSRSFALTERLEIRPESAIVALTPGQAVPVRLTLINRGPFQDLLTVTVSGVPEGWVSGVGGTLLRPGEQAAVTLTVMVPPSSDVAAGERLVKLRARSREQPAEGAQIESRWTVLPFYAADLTLMPARATGRTAASYQVTLRNTGNAAVRYQLTAQDDAGDLQYTFTPGEVELEGGQSAAARLVVGASGRLFGARVPRRFNVSAATTGAAAIEASATGQFVQAALLPVWSIAAAAGLVALVVLLGLLPRPTFGSALAGLPIGFLNPQLATSTAPATSVVADAQGSTAAAIQLVTQKALQVAVANAVGAQPPTQTFVAGLAATSTAVAQAATVVAAQTVAANATASMVAQTVAAGDSVAAQAVTAAAQQTSVVAAQLIEAKNGQAATAGAQAAGTAAGQPTALVAQTPTASPTEVPTEEPTEEPTVAPTDEATVAPTTAPTAAPTAAPIPITATNTPTPTSTATNTPTPTSTATNTPTSTVPVSPTSAPYIKLIYPSGGECWVRGQTYTIRWESNISDNVKLMLKGPPYDGSGGWFDIVGNTPNNGAFDYAIPANYGYNSFRIYVMSLDSSIKGSSDISSPISGGC